MIRDVSSEKFGDYLGENTLPAKDTAPESVL